MAKKIFKAVLTFGILLGCFRVYVHAFAIVVDHLRQNRNADATKFVPFPSKSKQQANKLAKEEFGEHHWTADPDLPFRYYNSDRGFWMYAQNVRRIVEEDGIRYDGKRVRMAPFALIWKSADGASTKTILSDEAKFDLNEPVGLNTNPGGESLKVKHAWIEKNVMIRDNRGTPRIPGDDMNIGPLTAVEYDEATQQILSDSDVVIEDREMRITGIGMKIQLRAKDPTAVSTGTSSAGFEGAETLYLFKNVHVIMNDVGKSGILPGSAQPRKSASGEVKLVAGAPPEPVPSPSSNAPVSEPTPLDVRSEATMRVDMPKPQTPVEVGPPERPGPTLVQFERNVVVLRGPIGSKRDQLNCDTLKLTMVPGEKPMPTAAVENSAQAQDATGTRSPAASKSGPASEPSDGGGLFGGLTLQRAHATGHAVWLYLPAQGTKIRCNELIHKRLVKTKPDETYLRGDTTRPLELWKIDVAEGDDPETGKETSATYIRTVDATLFDSGTGLDSANVIARGPGRMETRPDREGPVERIAVWQRQLEVKNVMEDDGRLKQKIIVLTGNRPCFIDAVRKTSLDAGATIYVWLKPKPSAAAASQFETPSTTNQMAAAERPEATAADKTHSSRDHAASDIGGGNLQIERLLAHRDVHLIAPSKTMTARERLDADFVDAQPTPATAPANTPAASMASAEQPSAIETNPIQQTTAPNAETPQATDPPMVGSAERVWALIAQSAAPKPTVAAGKAAGADPSVNPPDAMAMNSDVRKAWFWGNVALHQDPAPGKKKGQDAVGEAMFIDNRGPSKAFTRLYHRDPTDKTPRPGPIPPARIENDDIIIVARSGYAGMDQALDQAWVEGAGSMIQLADRGFLTDKSPESPDATPAEAVERAPDGTPKTRAGRPLTEKVPLTISFTERMRFFGRTKDPEGNPSARADFYGIVNARMEDALLHCEEQMHAFTDKEVPLAELGKMSNSKPGVDGAQPADDAEQAESKAQLALLYCYKNAWGISRKVDPDSPKLLEEQKILGIESLTYDRRTGEFEIPGEGIVWLYSRDNGDSPMPGATTEPRGPSTPKPGTTQTTRGRVVTPTAARTNGPPDSRAASRTRTTARPMDQPKREKSDEPPPLVLTQIQFKKGMNGRNGTGKENDKNAVRWSEFFGDIQVSRAIVPDDRTVLNPDRLPKDGFYLTGQTLRVITEPPPATAPADTPARNYLKAWERAQVTSSDKIMEADVITYDSYKDLMYAYGEHGRSVYFADQHAPGQPASQGSGRAVQFNPKTGASNVIDSDSMMMLDRKTGVRPTEVGAPDPYAKPKKKTRRPFRLPPANIERRNFTGS